MGADSFIQWCDDTLNVWHGCTKVSDGCKHTIVDYIETWASPVGNAFAYCDQLA